jgi:hypothetical protein
MLPIRRLLLAACTFAAPLSCSILPAPDDAADLPVQQRADRVIHEVARIRDVAVKQPVPAGERNKDELLTVMTAEVEKDWHENQRGLGERAYKAFGLLSADFDLQKFMGELLADQVAGYYDPEKDEFFMVTPKEGAKKKEGLAAIDDAITMPHELTHALEDQHFDLLKLQKSMTHDDDRAGALLALIEGSAMEGGVEHALDRAGIPVSTTGPIGRTVIDLIGGPGAGDTSQVDADDLDIVEDAEAAERLKRAPPIITRPLFFSYLSGWRFVNRVRSEYGWAAVNRMYADPPDSTEQILYPERYFDRRDRPVAITLGEPPAGFTPVHQQTLGFSGMRILLSGHLDHDDTDGKVSGTEAADGWDGDRYVLWENGNQDALGWVVAFDREGQAEDFESTWRKIQRARFGEETTWGVARDGAVVASVSGLSAGGDAAAQSLLAGSKVVAHEADENPGAWYWDALLFPTALQFFDYSWQWNVLGGYGLHYRNHDEGHRFHLLNGLALESESNADRNAFWCGLGLVGFNHDRTLDATFWRVPFLHNGHHRGDGDQYRSQYGLALDALLYANSEGRKHVSLLWDVVLDIKWGELQDGDRHLRFLFIPIIR